MRLSKRVALTIFIGVVALAIFLGAWAVAYPSPDPRNFRYVLWKAGLYHGDLEEMTGTMVGDPHSRELVIGKTKAELRERFGPMLTLDEASEYMKVCFQASGRTDRDVLFIRTGPWMVVFDGDRATELVLLKGC